MKVKDWLTKNRWIQGRYFEDKNGNVIDPLSRKCSYQNPKIEKTCLLGAIWYCYPEGERDEVKYLIKTYLKLDCPIYNWNDDPNRTWEEVQALVEELDI